MTGQLTAGVRVWFLVDDNIYTGVITARAKDGSYSVADVVGDPDDYGSATGLRLSDLYETEAEARAAMQADGE